MDDVENRKKVRFSHISPLQVKDLRSGQIYEARMFNFSDNGIYFESNGVFQKGAKIYISIQNSPLSGSSGVLKYHKGEVIWRKNLKRSFFDYGYGIQFSGSNKENLESSLPNIPKDFRKHPRKPFFRKIQFSSDKGVFEGSTINISASGVFIAAEEKFEAGQTLKLRLQVKGKPTKIIGQVVWVDEEGFGLKFRKMG
jgi:Tfp pilus assembly protein PilZ